MNRRRARALAAVAALVLLLTTCSAGETSDPPHRTTTEKRAETTTTRRATTTTTTRPKPKELDWRECDGGFECAGLEVPVDYAEPDGEQLTLGLVRRKATDPAQRVGSLVMNPGGPGGSAVDFVEGVPMPQTITERFDLIGFDPRGVGRSDGLDCRRHLKELYDADPTIEDAADTKALLQVSREFVDECTRKYRKLLPHLGTVNVAKDMERIREALGEPKLNYLGFSYGTSIGQQYARLYPTHVRTMVLDGVVDQKQTGLEAATRQAAGFTHALDAFISQCDTNGCGLSDPARETVDRVIADSEKAPIPAPKADRPATPGVVSLAIARGLYSPGLWPQLGRALKRGATGNGSGLVALADEYLQRRPDGTYPNGTEIYFAVSCLDSTWPRDPAEVLAAGKAAGKQFPQVGEAIVNDYVRCALWPTPPQPLKPIDGTVRGLPPIVLVSTTNDPATPYDAGVRVSKQIPGSILVTNEGEGHTIFSQGKACIDEPIVAYLVAGTPPPKGLICT